jgi:hypothetical protein
VAGQQFPPFVGSATADSGGAATVTFTPRSNDLYRVTQVAVEMTGSGTAKCSIRRNGALVSPVVPTGDAAGGDPPIWLWPGDSLTVEWTSAPVGGIGKVTVFYDLGG